jgi:regulator of protease activity HflC (stomatin/prohibitin superfamily)
MNTPDPFLTSAAVLGTTTLGVMIWKKFSAVTVVPMNHRGLHSRNGKLIGLMEPGRHRFFGTGHLVQLFDDRLQQVTLQTQELTTVEGVTVKTTVVGLYRIADPVMATSSTADFNATLYTLIQLALRDAVNGMEAETLLAQVRTLGPKLLEVVQPKATGLGLELTELVVRDVILPAEIKAALSEAWRAKKTAVAELEVARGKTAVARTLANAAKMYEDHPAMLKVRYIEALEQASKGMGNTFVVGMPDEKALKHI